MLNMWSCTVKVDEEKVKYAGLGQENCFAQHNWWKAPQCSAPALINMIWLLVSIFNWPIIMIGPGGLLLVVPHLFAVPGYGGVEKK